MPTTVFEVEQAGCASCAALVRDAVADLAPVDEVTIDEAADLATVRLAAGASAREEDVNRVLAEVAREAGHAYRVRPGSWQTR